MAYNYFVNSNFNFMGIFFTDFFGDDLIKKAISTTTEMFGKCTDVQVSEGCTVCSKAGDCLVCDAAAHYVYNPSTLLCDAETGYYLDASYIPVPCSDAMAGCEICDSSIVCTKCDTYAHYFLDIDTCVAEPGYYLDVNSIPQPCTITGCAECSSEAVCTLCSENNNFISDGADGCTCDATGFFTLDPSLTSCICMTGRFLNTAGVTPICD